MKNYFLFRNIYIYEIKKKNVKKKKVLFRLENTKKNPIFKSIPKAIFHAKIEMSLENNLKWFNPLFLIMSKANNDNLIGQNSNLESVWPCL